MKNLMKYVALTLVLCISIMGMTACGSSEKPSGDTGSGKLEDLLFVTGPQGGAWYAVSASMAEAIMKDVSGTRVTAIEGGALGNVRTVNSGEAQIGLVWSAFYQDGKDGVNSFEKDGKLGNIKPIMSIQENFIYIVTTTDTKINKLEDLIGKKVVPGAVASGGEFTFKNVLAAAGITYDDIEKAGGDVIFTDYGEAATLIKDGQIDAFVLTGPAKHNLLMDIETVKNIKIVPIEEDVLDKFTTDFPGFGKGKMPMGIYKGQEAEIPTPVSYTTILVNSSLSDELVEKLTKAIFENKDTFAQVHPDFAFMSKETAASGFSKNELHPGAAKYFGF